MSITRVSVIVPSYGTRGRLLARAIASAKAQTHPNLEVVVVDDGTPDESVRYLAEEWGVRYIRLPDNSGPSAARNAGVGGATGSAICFLDSDDEMPPSRVALQVGTEFLGVVGGRLRVYSTGQTFDGLLEKHDPLLILGPGGYPSITPYLFPRALLLEYPFDENMRRAEDRDLMIRLILGGVAVLVHPHVTSIVHDHQGGRLTAPRMVGPLGHERLFLKHGALVKTNRKLLALWEFRVAQEMICSGRSEEGFRWFRRSLMHDPLHPRRALLFAYQAVARLRRDELH